MRKSYRGPFINAYCKMLLYLAKWFQKIFSIWPIRNKNCLWQPCLLTDQDKMSNLYQRPSIDASYQVSVHLAKGFQRRRFLEIDQLFVNRSGQNEQSSIYASHQVSVHLAKRFQRRLKCEKLTNDGSQARAKAHMAFWPGELKTENTFRHCLEMGRATILLNQSQPFFCAKHTEGSINWNKLLNVNHWVYWWMTKTDSKHNSLKISKG